MPATPDDLFAYLAGLGIAHATVTHPPLFTVEQSQALRGTIPGGHTKNLFLKDKKDAVYLVVAPEDARVDLKTLHRQLGAGGRFSFGSSNLMRELLGVEPGAVTAFGVINDTARRVTVVIDAGLMQNAIINCHPLVNTMTTSIARRPGEVPGGDRARAADRIGRRRHIRRRWNPIAFGRPVTHLVV